MVHIVCEFPISVCTPLSHGGGNQVEYWDFNKNYLLAEYIVCNNQKLGYQIYQKLCLIFTWHLPIDNDTDTG